MKEHVKFLLQYYHFDSQIEIVQMENICMHLSAMGPKFFDAFNAMSITVEYMGYIPTSLHFNKNVVMFLKTAKYPSLFIKTGYR